MQEYLTIPAVDRVLAVAQGLVDRVLAVLAVTCRNTANSSLPQPLCQRVVQRVLQGVRFRHAVRCCPCIAVLLQCVQEVLQDVLQDV